MGFPLSPDLASIDMPAIPRLLVALSEWGAVACVVLLMKRRFRPMASALLLALALPIQIILRCVHSGHMELPVFSAFMLLNVAFMLLCILLLTKEPLRIQVYAWLLGFLLAEFAASLIWQLCCTFAEAPSLAEPPVLALVVLSLLLINVGCWFFIRKREETIFVQAWNYTLLAAGITLLVFVSSNVNVFRDHLWLGSSSRDMRSMIGWIRTILDLCGLILLWLLLHLSREQRLQQDMKAMEQLMDAQYQQYLAFRDNNEYIRRQCHDLKHQIAALRQDCSREDREEYLSELEQAVLRYQSQCDTGSKVLDTILTQKLQFCNQNGIALNYSVSAASLNRLATRDICNVFGNLLDNAIEAVQRLPAPDRMVQMDVTERGSFLSVCIENRCPNPPRFQNGLPVTTKSDGRYHGIGVGSVRYTVEQYGGSVQFEARDGWFTAAVLIPIDGAQGRSKAGGQGEQPKMK